jgi:hypothetical protein
MRPVQAPLSSSHTEYQTLTQGYSTLAYFPGTDIKHMILPYLTLHGYMIEFGYRPVTNEMCHLNDTECVNHVDAAAG